MPRTSLSAFTDLLSSVIAFWVRYSVVFLIIRKFDDLSSFRYSNVVNIENDARGGGGHLVIQQSKDGFNQSDWEKVLADAIIPVEINGLVGAYVQGIFVVNPGETSATQNTDAPVLRLRWWDGGTWFEIRKYGDVEVIEYLDQNGLVKLAESLFVQPYGS